MRKPLIITVIIMMFLSLIEKECHAFWIWTPKAKTIVNPKFAVKDSPKEQFEWSMHFYKLNDFQRAADEFIRLSKSYPDSEFSPEAQYYAGRSYEELAKYYFAYLQYQKTVDNYPFTKRMEEINEREYNIANILQEKEYPKLMEMELSISLERAITIYGKVVENSPFGEYATKALYKKGQCCRRVLRYKDAIEAYEKIINDYPESKSIPEAKYQLAYTRYEASLDPEYDQESTEKALQEFQQISHTTSVPEISKEAVKMMGELKEKKANSMMKIAEFYEARGKYRSANIYYKDVAGKFPGTVAAGKASEKVTILEEKIKK